MLRQLASHNPDIALLMERGYAIALDPFKYLVIRDIPYLDQDRKLCRGAIVTKLRAIDQNKMVQENHQIFFAGSMPHGLDGKPIPNLGNSPTSLALSDSSKDVVVERAFSNKPKGSDGYPNFYEKIENYVTLISGPAITLHGAKPWTYRLVDGEEDDSPFKIWDTLTSRAEIGDLSAKFKDEIVAIIGLGGTGAYLLDFLAKTPVREIRGFDPDFYFVHNAFRSPGAFAHGDFGKPKADIYQGRYDNFRNRLNLQRTFIDSGSAADLKDVTFAFVCVDKGEARKGIFDLLLSMGIPFIDVGMGLSRSGTALNGMIRATLFSTEQGKNTRELGLAPLVDDPRGLYRTTVQIAELNAINAAFAVMMYKQLRGFYVKRPDLHHLLFGVGNLKVQTNAETEEN